MLKRVDRPWGYWKEVFRCKWFCIKLLHFNKLGKISMQRHNFRYEWWLILDGWGMMVWEIGSMDVNTFEHFLIKKRKWHRFFAPYNREVKILEIQFGSDVRESDIERL